jgi:TonB-linked SusC/RagA family outer membrane protein
MTTLTARMDGSSRFGGNNKYAFFPSAGLGWIASNEDFLKDGDIIDLLKFHSSYGVTGNTEIGAYKSLATMEAGNVLLNGVRVPSSITKRLSNPDLKWEKTTQFDFGMNLNLFNHRLNFDVSYYHKLTTDLLLDRPVPHSTGFDSVIDNIGEVSNQGIDLMINTVNVDYKDFNWSSTININYNKNRIEALGENNEDIQPGPHWVSGSQTILRVGEPLSSFYGYERIGIWGEDEAEEAKAAGAAVGVAKRSEEKKILGSGLPAITGSVINNFRYKNFDLTLDLQFVTGVDILQQYSHSIEDRFGYSNGLSTMLYDGWRPDNTNTMVQAVRNATIEGVGQSSEVDSRWVCDGSYLRANLIQVGYTFDSGLLKKLRISSLRTYVSVNNAFVIDSKDFHGYDPEGTSHSDNQWGQNMFFFQYPKPRTFTFGLNVVF